jgi:hypothetical protein
MLALKPNNDDEEREAIFSVLDHNHKIEVIWFVVNEGYRITYTSI